MDLPSLLIGALIIIIISFLALAYAIFLLIENWGSNYQTIYKRIIFCSLPSFLAFHFLFAIPAVENKVNSDRLILKNGIYINTHSKDTVKISSDYQIRFSYFNQPEKNFTSSYFLQFPRFDFNEIIFDNIVYYFGKEPEIKYKSFKIESPGEGIDYWHYISVTADELTFTPHRLSSEDKQYASISYIRHK